MADGFSVEIKGLDELKKQLDQLSNEKADYCIRKSVRDGASIVRHTIQEYAPRRVNDRKSKTALPPNAVANDITVRVTRSDQGNIAAIIGPGKLTSHVVRWLEYGHRLVRGGYSRVLKNGKTRGPGREVDFVEAVNGGQGFVRPAFEASRAAVIDTMTKTLAVEIEKAGKGK